MNPPVEEMIECLKRLEKKHPNLRLDLDWQTTVAIISHLQLALRHPGNKGHTARMVREFVDALITNVSRVEPKLARILRMGDDPQHDV